MVNLLRIVIIAITIVIVIIINVKVFCWAAAAGGSLIGELAAHTCQEKTRNATIGIGAKINKDQQCQERPTKARIGIGAKSAGWLSGRGIKRGRGGERGVARGGVWTVQNITAQMCLSKLQNVFKTQIVKFNTRPLKCGKFT